MHEDLIRSMLADGRSLVDNPYRLGSDKWGEFVREARALYDDNKLPELDEDSYHLLEGAAAALAEFEDKVVMLEVPIEDFDEPGWFFVYVYDGEKVQKLRFEGDVTDLNDVTLD